MVTAYAVHSEPTLSELITPVSAQQQSLGNLTSQSDFNHRCANIAMCLPVDPAKQAWLTGVVGKLFRNIRLPARIELGPCASVDTCSGT